MIVRYMEAAEILHIGAFADGNIIHVAPGDHAGPEAGLGSYADVAVEMYTGRDKGVFIDLRRLALKFLRMKCIHAMSSFQCGEIISEGRRRERAVLPFP